MTQLDPEEPTQIITAKRRLRIEKELELMGRGIWTYSAIAEEIGVSEPTVKRDMNHPYALEYIQKLQESRIALVDQLIKRQIEQIESGVVPPQTQLYIRAKLIDKLLPSKIMQKVDGEIRTYDVETLLDRMLKQDEILKENM